MLRSGLARFQRSTNPRVFRDGFLRTDCSAAFSRSGAVARPIRLDGRSGGRQGSWYQDAWEYIANFGPRHPFLLAVGIAAVKTGCADYIVQKVVERKEKVDKQRVLFFATFGFLYFGVFQYAIYINLFKRLFVNANRFGNLPWRQKLRDTAGMKDLSKQVLFDNFIVSPFIFFPIYYFVKEGMQGDPSQSIMQKGRQGLTHYREYYWEDLVAMWKIWIVGDAVVFAIPLWARLPVNNTLSFFYVCILSAMRGAKLST